MINKSNEKSAGIGYTIGLALAVAALAALAVAAIVQIIHAADHLKDMNDWKKNLSASAFAKYEDEFNASVKFGIMMIADNAVRLLSVIAFVVLCVMSKKVRPALLGVPLLIYALPTLKFLASSIFGFGIVSKYYHGSFVGDSYHSMIDYTLENDYQNDLIKSAYKTQEGIMIALFVAAVVMFIVSLSLKQGSNMAAKAVAGLLLVALIVTAFIVMKDILDQLPDNDLVRSEEMRNIYAKLRTSIICGFITTVALSLSMGVTMFLTDSGKKQLRYA